MLKADRGRAVHSDQMLGLDYWVERNFNIETDTSINATAPARDQELATLKADPTLATLHEAAVEWRRARFDALMQQDPFRALFGRLLMAPPSRPVTAKAAGFMVKFARRDRERKSQQ